MDDANLRKWLGGVFSILEIVNNQGLYDIINKSFVLKTSPEVYIQILSQMERFKEKKHLRKYFKASLKEGQIAQVLQKMVTDGQFDENAYAALKILLLHLQGNPASFGSLVDPLLSRLQSGGQHSAIEIAGASSALLLLASQRVQGAENAVEQFARSGWAFDRLHWAKAENYLSAISACVIAILWKNPSGGIPSTQAQMGNGLTEFQNLFKAADRKPELLNRLIGDIVEFNLWGRLADVMMSEPQPGYRVFQAVFDEVLTREDVHQLLGSDFIIDKYPFLQKWRETSEEHIRLLLEKAVVDGNIIEKIVGRELNNYTHLASDLYQIAQADKRGKLRDWITSELEGLSEEDWLAAIKGSGDPDLIPLATGVGSSVDPFLGQPLYEALRSVVEASLEEGTPEVPDNQIKNWKDLLPLLKPSFQKTLKQYLRDSVLNRIDSHDLGIFFHHFGSTLLTDKEVLEEEADRVIRVIAYAIVNRGDSAKIQWLNELFHKCPQVWIKANKDSQEAFRETLNSKFKAEQDESKKALLQQISQRIEEIEHEPPSD